MGGKNKEAVKLDRELLEVLAKPMERKAGGRKPAKKGGSGQEGKQKKK